MRKNRLKELRLERGLSLVQLAEQSGIPHATCIKVEKNEENALKATVETYIKFAEFYGVSLDYIVGYSNKLKALSEITNSWHKEYINNKIKNPKFKIDNTCIDMNRGLSYPYNLLRDIFSIDVLTNNEENIHDLNQLIFLLEDARSKISERENKIIYLNYQMDQSLNSIGSLFGVTKERIRQVIQSSLRKLRYELQPILFKPASQINKENEIKNKEVISLLKNAIIKLEDNIGNKITEKPEENKPIESDHIIKLHLSPRCYNALVSNNIKTIGDIINYNNTENKSLIELRSMGSKTYNELINILSKKNIEVW